MSMGHFPWQTVKQPEGMFGDYNQRYVFGDPHGNPEGYDMSGGPGH